MYDSKEHLLPTMSTKLHKPRSRRTPVDNSAMDGSQDLQPLLVLFQHLRQPVTERALQGQGLISSSSSSPLLYIPAFPLVLRLVQNL